MLAPGQCVSCSNINVGLTRYSTSGSNIEADVAFVVILTARGQGTTRLLEAGMPTASSSKSTASDNWSMWRSTFLPITVGLSLSSFAKITIFAEILAKGVLIGELLHFKTSLLVTYSIFLFKIGMCLKFILIWLMNTFCQTINLKCFP